jgi:Fic family protein
VKYPEIPKLTEKLCDFANSKDVDFIHLIIKGIIVHFLIGYIHPFNDGNRRTARAVFYWYLLKNEYWLFEYMAVSRVINNSKKQYRNACLYTESARIPQRFWRPHIFHQIKPRLRQKSPRRNP